MKKHTLLCSFLGAGLLTVAAFSNRAAAQSVPTWLEDYRENPLPEWDGWRNALSPEGELSEPLALAEDRRTDYVIILPADATPEETVSAEELQRWLGEITGVFFPIRLDFLPPQAREFSVGQTNRAEEAGLLDAHPDLGEGYVIAVEDERVYLLGGERAGPFHAVLALLEEDLGCRWYAPGVERIPYRPTLRTRIASRTYTPHFRVRDVRYFWNFAWRSRNRLSYTSDVARYTVERFPEPYAPAWVASVHSAFRMVPPETYFDEHPEYYSLIDGERVHERGQLCLSNPEIPEVAAETILSDLRENGLSRWQTLPIVIGPMDYRRRDCHCEECRAMEEELGSLGGLYLHVSNRIADRIREEYPDLQVACSAYWVSKKPPTDPEMQARDNVVIRYWADFEADFRWLYHSFYDAEEYAIPRADFERWSQISDGRVDVGVYPHQYSNPLAPEPNIHKTAENLRFFAEQDAARDFMHIHTGYAASRWDGGWMMQWIFAKLIWDPSLDVNDLMLDFIWGYYGEAAPAVAEYHRMLLRRLDEYEEYKLRVNYAIFYAIHNRPFLQHGFVEEARAILNRGLERAETEAVRRRVEWLLASVAFVETAQLYGQMRDTETPPPPRARVDAAMAEFERLFQALATPNVHFYFQGLYGDRYVRLDTWMESFREAKREADAR